VNRGLLACLVAAPAVLTAAGCIAPKRVEPLGDAVRLFNDAVRWQRHEAAATRILPEQRDDFLDRRDQLADDLRISHYEVIRVRLDETGRRAKVHIKYTWHRDSRGVVHTTHSVQSWRRPGPSWVRMSEVHLRGEPMPGVEPAPARPPPANDHTDAGKDLGEFPIDDSAGLREPVE
jgi:hypothetical protein